MKRHKLLPVTGLFCLLFVQFIGCTYQFEEDYYVKVDSPVANANLSIDSINNSLRIIQKTRINYCFSSPNQQFYGIEVLINDVEHFNSDLDTGYFEIDPLDFGDGTFNLEVIYIFSSGNNSLADRIGAEYFIKKKKIELTIDISPPELVEITDITIENGTIYVQWNDIKKNYTKLTLVGVGYLSRYFDVTNYSGNIFKDSLTTNNYCRYQLIVEGYNYKITSNEKSYLVEKPKFKLNYYNSEKCSLEWEQHPLYSNFNNYIINIEGNKLTLDKMGGERVVDVIPILGNIMNSRVYFDGPEFYNESMGTLLYIGTRSSDYHSDGFIYHKETNKYFSILKDNGNLILREHDIDTMSITLSINVGSTDYFEVSIYNDYNTKNIIINTCEKQYMFDPFTYELEVISTTSDYYTGLLNKAENINGILVIQKWYGNVKIFSTKSGKLIYDSEISNNFNLPMSNDGRVFINNDSVFIIENEEAFSQYMIDGNIIINDSYIDIENDYCYFVSYGFDYPVKMNLTTGEISTLATNNGTYSKVFHDEFTNTIGFEAQEHIIFYKPDKDNIRSMLVTLGNHGEIVYYQNGRLIRNELSYGIFLDF